MESQLQKQHFCLILLLELMETERKPPLQPKCYYASFSDVGRGKDSKCIHKNVKSVIVFYMTLTTNYLDWKQVQKNIKSALWYSNKGSK